MTIFGLSSLRRSYPRPILARKPGRMASMTTSDSRTSSSNTAIASGCLRFSTSDCLPRFTCRCSSDVPSINGQVILRT